MKASKIYIGFFTYAYYDKLIVASSEELCWKLMKREYYKWRKAYNGSYTWKYAVEYYGYKVESADPTGDIITY